MARIRITLEDDDGRPINGDKERVYGLPIGALRFVDIEAAVEGFKQAALPELEAELLMLAQHQFVTDNWLQVLGTTETPQIDQGVGHQFHPVVALLDVLKTEEQALAFVLPRKRPLDALP